MEFQLSYSKSWNMMLWKCCTQYARKFGKLSSGHRTEKGQFSFQSQHSTRLSSSMLHRTVWWLSLHKPHTTLSPHLTHVISLIERVSSTFPPIRPRHHLESKSKWILSRNLFFLICLALTRLLFFCISLVLVLDSQLLLWLTEDCPQNPLLFICIQFTRSSIFLR